jgi:hypothetical protein
MFTASGQSRTTRVLREIPTVRTKVRPLQAPTRQRELAKHGFTTTCYSAHSTARTCVNIGLRPTSQKHPQLSTAASTSIYDHLLQRPLDRKNLRKHRFTPNEPKASSIVNRCVNLDLRPLATAPTDRKNVRKHRFTPIEPRASSWSTATSTYVYAEIFDGPSCKNFRHSVSSVLRLQTPSPVPFHQNSRVLDICVGPRAPARDQPFVHSRKSRITAVMIGAGCFAYHSPSRRTIALRSPSKV